MSTLKELTHELHVEAEAHPFTQDLLSGTVLVSAYATLLANQLIAYTTLENLCLQRQLLVGIEPICRSELILQDVLELNKPVHILPSTKKYLKHIKQCSDLELLAHMYVKHMGDLYGGQILKQKVPGCGSMYDFENRKMLIEKFREKLDISMADEAKISFRMTLDLFTEIYNEYYI
jgi:heme oxygenase